MRVFHLKTWNTSANFRFLGNLPFMIAPLTSFCKKLDETLTFFQYSWRDIVIGSTFSWVDVFNSFSTSVLLTSEKKNLYLLDILLWINKMLWWCLYLAIALWTGWVQKKSSLFGKSMTLVSSLTFGLLKVWLK